MSQIETIYNAVLEGDAAGPRQASTPHSMPALHRKRS